MKQIQLIGIPMALQYPADLSKRSLQVKNAPDAIRTYLQSKAPQFMSELHDRGNVPIELPEQASSFAKVETAIESIRTSLANWIREDTFSIILGGECDLAFGTFSAIKKVFPHIHLLWIDSHADFLNEKTSSTGYLGGMALASIVGHTVNRERILDGDRVTLISAQLMEPPEKAALQEYGIHHVQQDKLEGWMKSSIPKADTFIHLDVDAIHTHEMPAVDFPNSNGLTSASVIDLVRAIAENSTLRGIEIAGFNPELDKKDKGMQLVLSILKECTREPIFS
ncbi:arginase family protein [Ferroacidibacillus organovorans]|uniref:Arginase n=1 Tax=Ferroacidibacillus organovorans TaxID=1765683 RepID=A0A101XQB6_9BACL|nr:arginase family protein [Ferroacidibacillus organovorans]KUO95529.1 hypothetical protein ATW55_06465 [Ferroacidibacillus organovorans]